MLQYNSSQTNKLYSCNNKTPPSQYWKIYPSTKGKKYYYHPEIKNLKSKGCFHRKWVSKSCIHFHFLKIENDEFHSFELVEIRILLMIS